MTGRCLMRVAFWSLAAQAHWPQQVSRGCAIDTRGRPASGWHRE